ncbi:hypothetical protein LINPERHAP1_LOCUS4016 [Linum perenne]
MISPQTWFGSLLSPLRSFAFAGRSFIERWQHSTTSNGKASLLQTGVSSVAPTLNRLIIFSFVVSTPRKSGLFSVQNFSSTVHSLMGSWTSLKDGKA